MLQILALGTRIGKRDRKETRVLAVRPNEEDLLHMTGMYESGKIRAVIDRSFSLEEVPEALQYLGEGHAKGKIVIKVAG